MGDDLPEFDLNDTDHKLLKFDYSHYLTMQQIRRFAIWLDFVPTLILALLTAGFIITAAQGFRYWFVGFFGLLALLILWRVMRYRIYSTTAFNNRAQMQRTHQAEIEAQQRATDAELTQLLKQAQDPDHPDYEAARAAIHRCLFERGHPLFQAAWRLELTSAVRTIAEAIEADRQLADLRPAVDRALESLAMARGRAENAQLPTLARIKACRGWRRLCSATNELILTYSLGDRSILSATIKALHEDDRISGLPSSIEAAWRTEYALRWQLLQAALELNDQTLPLDQDALREHRDWIWRYVQPDGFMRGRPYDRHLPDDWDQVVVAVIEPRTIDLADWYDYLSFDRAASVEVATWFVRSVVEAIRKRESLSMVMSAELLIAAYYLHHRTDVSGSINEDDREVVLGCHHRLAQPYRPRLRLLTPAHHR